MLDSHRIEEAHSVSSKCQNGRSTETRLYYCGLRMQDESLWYRCRQECEYQASLGPSCLAGPLLNVRLTEDGGKKREDIVLVAFVGRTIAFNNPSKADVCQRRLYERQSSECRMHKYDGSVQLPTTQHAKVVTHDLE